MAISRAKGKASTAAFKGTYYVAEDRQDPIVDAVHTIVDECGENLNRISTRANVARGTLDKWLDGTTREPRYSKIAGVLGACGFKLQIVQDTEMRKSGVTIKATAPRIIRNEPAKSRRNGGRADDSRPRLHA